MKPHEQLNTGSKYKSERRYLMLVLCTLESQALGNESASLTMFMTVDSGWSRVPFFHPIHGICRMRW